MMETIEKMLVAWAALVKSPLILSLLVLVIVVGLVYVAFAEGRDWEREHRSEGWVLFYTSADGPEPDSPWSVYVEEYLHPDSDEPIPNTQQFVARFPSEDEAKNAMLRLQQQAR